MSLSYLSICSGIEAASVAWHPLGWRAVGYAEIDPFASSVLAERFGSNLPGDQWSGNAPPNFGDFTAIDLAALPAPIDVLVGGTPCQDFSFAGTRQSLRGARGNLTLAYVVLAHELARSHGLRNALWENVPGVLSTDDNAFGCFLGGVVGADHPIDLPRGIERWPDEGMVEGPRARAAWRVLDAQYFGLAQRRERVFVVVDFGIGADPAAVLFEPQGLRGNSAPRREAGQGVAGTLSARTHGGGGLGTDFELAGGLIAYGGNNTSGAIDVAAALTAHGRRQDFSSETFIAFVPERAAPLTRGADSQEKGGYAGRRQEDDVNLVAVYDAQQITSPTNRSNPKPYDPCFTLHAGQPPLGTFVGADGYSVRRLTPVECARLQGFPDHHSRIAWRGKPAEACPDGPQYKTLGNSMAVNVMRWLGERLAAEMPR